MDGLVTKETHNMNPEDQIPDLYKLPPMEFQAYDEWKKDSGDDGDSPYLPEPEPDYSDDDDDVIDLNDYDPQYDTDVWQSRKENLKDQLNLLSKDEYNKIVASAESTVQTVDIPEPDYLDQEEAGEFPDRDSRPRSPSYSSSILTMPPQDTNGTVIEPRKLDNPCLESRDRQNLHKELLLNQKLGIDVLHQKSELKKELERRKNIVKKKEQVEYQRNKRTSLEVKLEEQANKLKEVDKPEQKPILEEKEAPEFLKVHSKINRAKLDS